MQEEFTCTNHNRLPAIQLYKKETSYALVRCRFRHAGFAAATALPADLLLLTAGMGGYELCPGLAVLPEVN